MRWPWQKEEDPYGISPIPEVKTVSRRPLMLVIMALLSTVLLMMYFAIDIDEKRRETRRREVPTPPMITAEELKAIAERKRRKREREKELDRRRREEQWRKYQATLPEKPEIPKRPPPFAPRESAEERNRSMVPAGFANHAKPVAEEPSPPPPPRDPTQDLVRAMIEAQRAQSAAARAPASEARPSERASPASAEERRAPKPYQPRAARLHRIPSRYLLQAGSYLGLVLESHVHSEVPGQVVARVAHDVYDSLTARHLLIPAGSRVVGRLEGGARLGDRRVQIAWERLQYPDGRTLMLGRSPTADRRGAGGVEDRAKQHWGRLYRHAFLTSLVSAAGQLSQPQRSASGFHAASPGQEAAGQVGRDLSRVTERVLERNLAVEPTLEIRPGTLLHLVVTEDFFFRSPYGAAGATS